VEKTNTVKNGKRQGHTNNHLMKAKRSLDEAMVQLAEFPELRDRVGELREDVLQAFVERERKALDTSTTAGGR